MPLYTTASTTDASLVAQQLLGEPYPLAGISSTTIMVSGTAYAVAVRLSRGQVATSLASVCTTAGSSLTLVKLGLYDKTGVQLAATADVKAAYGSTGKIVSALSASYLVPATDLYYAVAVAVGTTPPTMMRGNGTAAAAAAVGIGKQPFGTQTGQSDLPSPLTLGTTSAIAYWLAVA